MLKDLDRLMDERGIDAIVVVKTGSSANPAFTYVTRGGHFTTAYYVHQKGKTPHLVHGPMERDQAAATGYATSDFNAHAMMEILEAEPDEGRARIKLVRRILGDLGVHGRTAFYGIDDIAKAHTLLLGLAAEMKEIQVVAESGESLLDVARRTKDDWEIGEIKKAARGTIAGMAAVREFLREAPRRDGRLFRPDGKPATIGDLRRLLRITFAEHGLIESQGSIVAGGRDCGVPHNQGDDAMPIAVGMPVLIDIYPQHSGGGYYFDMTRTFVAGEASDELRRTYQEVREARDRAFAAMKSGQRSRQYQDLTCDYFESKGHATVRQNPSIEEGYVHGLGHGLGLDVHEKPRMGGPKNNTDILEPGTVVTVEPGLYYPSRGYGVRLEDVAYVRPDGTIENLTDFPLEMELG